ncbi:MAG: hypothetical protein WBM84_16630, partial [Sedimenticolaceae bacterium]
MRLAVLIFWLLGSSIGRYCLPTQGSSILAATAECCRSAVAVSAITRTATMAGPLSGLSFSNDQRWMVGRMFLRLFGGLLLLGGQQGLFFRFPIGFLVFGHIALLRVVVKQMFLQESAGAEWRGHARPKRLVSGWCRT